MSKWTEETCFEEAQKYTSSKEFFRKSHRAYEKAKQNGWIENYVWFVKSRKPSGYWDSYEHCYEEAKKYKTRIEFERNCSSAYRSSKTNGWLNDYDWLVKLKNTWAKESCEVESKKYSSRYEFECGSPGAYQAARRNGWLSEYTWLSCREKVLPGYWTYERCFEEAKKYKTRYEFHQKRGGAYAQALLNKWLDDYTWFSKSNVIDVKTYCIYAYEDKENRFAYVGLTKHVKRRDWEHRREKKRHGNLTFDTVYKYFNKTGKPIPKVIILEDKLTGKEASLREGYYADSYVKKGWSLINVSKTGALGGNLCKWTKEVCLEEAKKYTSKYEFQKNCYGAYFASLEKGWLDEYTWFTTKHKQNGHWNYETCLEEAKKYTTRSSYMRNSGGAYGVSLKNGWLDDYTWFISKRIEWTKEKCMLEAKKYHTRGGFKIGSQSAYNKARQNNWLPEYTWFSCKNIAPKGYWTYETCYNEARKYETKSDFSIKSNGAYRKARQCGWINDYTWLRKKTRKLTRWTYEKCFEEAKKYKSKFDFMANNYAAYRASIRHKWMKDYLWL